MSGCDSCSSDNIAKATKQQKRVLIIVLLINATMFVVEFSAGLASHSTALMADSLDMLADALVYALGLFALGRAEHWTRVVCPWSSGTLEKQSRTHQRYFSDDIGHRYFNSANLPVKHKRNAKRIQHGRVWLAGTCRQYHLFFSTNGLSRW